MNFTSERMALMGEIISFFVPGIPRPGGSKRALPIYCGKKGTPQRKWTGKTVVVDSSGDKGKNWRTDIQAEATKHRPAELITGPVHVTMTFFFSHPKSHYRSGKNSALLKESVPLYHIVKPDALKLGRATEDALTGIIWRDDSQIVTEHLQKAYRKSFSGVMISVTEL